MAPILGIWASSKAVATDTGAMFPLQVITVGAAGASSVTFTNIPSTYAHLQIRGISRNSANQDTLRVRLNSDTGSNYARHLLRGDGSAVASSAVTSGTLMGSNAVPASSTTASVFAGTIIDILDYANTNKYKTMRGLGGYDANGAGIVTFYSGLWQSTSAVTSVTLLFDSDNFVQYSQFALYGIKGA